MNGSNAILDLVSPLAGHVLSLKDVPDPAFASGVLGDGIAIDPTIGELRAPCDGVVLSPHASGHALTVKADCGAEVLMHIGIETVMLNGYGFVVHVKEGTRVAAGQLLVSFDIRKIAKKVPSMISMIIIANSDRFHIAYSKAAREIVFGERILALDSVVSDIAPLTRSDSNEVAEISIPLRIANGLHARPAAVLANAAKSFPGSVSATCGNVTINAKSVVAIMSLDARFNDIITLRLEGPYAEAEVDVFLDLLLSGLGDPVADQSAPVVESPAIAARPAAPSTSRPFVPGDSAALTGRSAVGGVAAGKAVRFELKMPEFRKNGKSPEVELARISQAVFALTDRLERSAGSDASHQAIFSAHRELLDDPLLHETAEREIRLGRSAEHAWNEACSTQIRMLGRMNNERMNERASDLHDIAIQIVSILGGVELPSLHSLPKGAIVVAAEIMPSHLSGIENGHIGALLMRDGGPTSHASIMAAGLGIPTIVALGPDADRIPEGAEIIVDADEGAITVYPSQAAKEIASRQIQALARRRASQRAQAGKDCRLRDGTRIEVFANLGDVGEVANAMQLGAEGCGLLRTEFLFQKRANAPSEDVQLADYQAIASGMPGKAVIIRTLDVGGDKPLPYLHLPREENPFLGLRGIRVGLAYPELLRTQLRAILRVKPYGATRIMVPMVASVSEMAAVRAMVEDEKALLGRSEPVEIGAMIETPAAAVISAQLSEVCDFFSIGTNDLTQYALAMDRGNPAVASGIDALHPGVLGLIHLTAKGGSANNRLVAVCGTAASDPGAALLLVGLGVRELSVAPAAIPEIKATLSSVTLEECHSSAMLALNARSSEEVRTIAAKLLAKTRISPR